MAILIIAYLNGTLNDGLQSVYLLARNFFYYCKTRIQIVALTTAYLKEAELGH